MIGFGEVGDTDFSGVDFFGDFSDGVLAGLAVTGGAAAGTASFAVVFLTAAATVTAAGAFDATFTPGFEVGFGATGEDAAFSGAAFVVLTGAVGAVGKDLDTAVTAFVAVREVAEAGTVAAFAAAEGFVLTVGSAFVAGLGVTFSTAAAGDLAAAFARGLAALGVDTPVLAAAVATGWGRPKPIILKNEPIMSHSVSKAQSLKV